MLGNQSGSIRLWEPAHGEVVAQRRRPQQRHDRGTRAYLSAGLPVRSGGLPVKPRTGPRTPTSSSLRWSSSTPSIACGTPPSSNERPNSLTRRNAGRDDRHAAGPPGRPKSSARARRRKRQGRHALRLARQTRTRRAEPGVRALTILVGLTCRLSSRGRDAPLAHLRCTGPVQCRTRLACSERGTYSSGLLSGLGRRRTG